MIPYYSGLKYLIIATVLAGSGYLVYNKIYTRGYEEAKTKYEQEVQDLKAEMLKKAGETEALSTILEYNRQADLKLLKDNLDLYISELRKNKRPITVITKEGKCAPNEVFIQTYNKVIDEANSTSK